MSYATYTKKAVNWFVIVFAVNMIAAFLGYIVRILLARNLTVAEYGLFFAIFTLINFLAIFNNLGMGQALVKYIPDFLVKKEEDKINSSVAITIAVHIVSFVVLALLLLVFSGFLAEKYFKTALAVPVLLAFILIMFFSSLRNLLRSIFQAFQKMTLYAGMYLAENALILILLMAFFIIKKDIFTAVYAHIAAYIFILVVFSVVVLKVFKFFKHKLIIKKDLVKKLFKFGIPVMFMGIGSIVILYIDTLVLTYFRSLEEVGIYNVVVPTVMMLMFFGKSIHSVIFPMSSELWARKKKKYLESGLVMLEKYSFVVIIPIALAMLAFSELFLNLLFGEQYIGGALTMQILIIGMIFLVIYVINSAIFSAIGKPEISTKILLQGALINLILNLIIIPSQGIVGAAITSLITYFYVFLMSVVRLRRYIKIRIPWVNWLKTFIAGVVFVGVIFLFKGILSLNIYLEAIIVIGLAGLIYIILILLMKIVDIREIQGFVSHVLNRNNNSRSTKKQE